MAIDYDWGKKCEVRMGSLHQSHVYDLIGFDKTSISIKWEGSDKISISINEKNMFNNKFALKKMFNNKFDMWLATQQPPHLMRFTSHVQIRVLLVQSTLI